MKGLELMLQRIFEAPTKKILKIRFLALVSELQSTTEKVEWCLKLARFYARGFPQAALQISYMVCKYDPDNVSALMIIIESFEALGRGDQAVAMRAHLSKVRQHLVGTIESQDVVKNLGLGGAFDREEAERTNPFLQSADQIISNESVFNNVVKASEENSYEESGVSNSNEDTVFRITKGKRQIHQENIYGESADLYQASYDPKKPDASDKPEEEETPEAERPEMINLFSNYENELDTDYSPHFQIEANEDFKSSMSMDQSKELAVNNGENTPDIATNGLKSPDPAVPHTKSKDGTAIQISSSKENTNVHAKEESSSIEKLKLDASLDVKNSEIHTAEKIENFKSASYKSYDSKVLMQMFGHFCSTNEFDKAKELLVSTAAFCSSEKWWKDSFYQIFDKILHHQLEDAEKSLNSIQENSYSHKSSPQGQMADSASLKPDPQIEPQQVNELGLGPIPAKTAKYSKALVDFQNIYDTGSGEPWSDIAEDHPFEKSSDFTLYALRHREILDEFKVFLMFIDALLFLGQARIVIGELARASELLDSDLKRCQVMLRWFAANQKLGRDVRTSTLKKLIPRSGLFEQEDIVRDGSENDTKILLNTRMYSKAQ